MLYPCKQCDGSIDSRNGICMDCGFDEMQHMVDWNEWSAYVSADDVELDRDTRWQLMQDRRNDDLAALADDTAELHTLAKTLGVAA